MKLRFLNLKYLNKLKFEFKFILFSTMVLILLFLSAEISVAQDESISLSLKTPFVFENIVPGETKLIQVQLENQSGKDVFIKSDIRSIDDVNEIGQIEISDRIPAWSEWINFDNSEFPLSSGEDKTFTFALDIPQSTGSGSYYAVISFSAYDKELPESEIFVNQSAGLGLVVMFNVIGEQGLINEGRIISWQQSGGWFGNNNLLLKYQNIGTSVYVPIATVNIYDWKGDKIDVNVLENHYLLPGKVRDYNLNWFPKDSFGLYSAEILLSNTGSEESSTLYFLSFTGKGLFILVGLFLLIFYIFIKMFIHFIFKKR